MSIPEELLHCVRKDADPREWREAIAHVTAIATVLEHQHRLPEADHAALLDELDRVSRALDLL